MPNKVYNVTITLPDLAAAHAEQEAKIESATWAAAVRLACDEISKRPHVLGKHIKSAKIYFSVIDSHTLSDKKMKQARDDEPAQGLLFQI
ncbi:MAG TPA: hypothetical protein VJQ56_05325 [Blastocatellia bacterium]|nr:hypothetical protein [Blastocatellia bacterium]